MTKPRLLILSFSNISADARVLKQVNLFADRYAVTTCGYGPSPHASVTHVELSGDDRLHRWRRRDLILRRFARMYWTQSAIQAARIALEPLGTFDAIVANDVDAVGLALDLKPRCGVHADIHEYAPRQNEEILVWRVFEAPYMRWLCRRFLTKAASVTTVGTGLANEYRRKFGVTADIVTNATPFRELSPTPVAKPIRLVHSGASLRNRRLEVLVDAVMATSNDVTLDMYLMGNDPAYVEELRQRAAGSDRIVMREPLPYAQLIDRLNAYDVGIHIIAPTNFNNRWSLPNKFFDYTQARLGLIIGPSPEMSSLLAEHGIGAVSADFGAPALTQVIDSLDVETVSGWKEHAHLAARALSSESQVTVWVAVIEQIIGLSDA